MHNAAVDPQIPIAFDEEMGEYQVKHKDGGQSVLYHCPWCGGVAPRSRRSSLFAAVPSSEWDRLARLTSSLKSLDEALAVLGPPDSEGAGDVRAHYGLNIETPASDREPLRAEAFRTLTFSKVSSLANVTLDDYGPKGIGFSFSAKYVGKTESSRPRRGSRQKRTPAKRRRH